MKYSILLTYILAAVACKVPPATSSTALLMEKISFEEAISLKHLEAEKRVEVYAGDKLMTAYQYGTEMEKPVLYPLHSPKGTAVTRGFPIDPRPGERTDHPHHIGVWLNYGDVNGLDFWNNSYRVKADRKHRYGRIVHESIQRMNSGKSGELSVSAIWKGEDGEELLNENTQFVFKKEEDGSFGIERITSLQAREKTVNFKDNKEGMFAIRVIRELEHPAAKPINVVGQDGKPMEEKVLMNEGVNGVYLSSQGVKGPSVWGTRAKWMRLGGEVNGGPVSLAIIDHPDNIGYPTYWHARAYGLFSANTLGQKAFSKGREELNFKLAPGQSVTFKYKLIVADEELSVNSLEAASASFAKK